MAVDAGCECNNSARVHRVRTQNMFKLVNLIFVCTLLVYRAHCVRADDVDCDSIRHSLQTRGLNNTELLSEPENAESLRVCVVPGKTCCSVVSEARLATHSRQQFERTVRESLVKLSSVLNTRSQRFDDFFRKMLANSKREFHEMFKKTYGIIYVQNSFVFTDLYEELENYYNKGQVDLSETIDTFFSVLYQRMFAVINSQYNFDEKYLTCVADHMKDLKPFGDVPHKFNLQIKRSFVATRTFSKALYVGADVAKNMLSIKPTQECVKSLLRMQHCSSCAGAFEAKACSNYCINVMKGCLAYHSSLENEWNNYVEAIDKISDRLLGPFNIQVVVEPIDIKISEAIMNFQENGPDVSQRVFTGCGKPVLGRGRRSARLPSAYSNLNHDLLRSKFPKSDDLDLQFEEPDPERKIARKTRSSNKELSFETLNFNDKGNTDVNNKGGKVAHNKPEEPTFEKLIKDIKHVVKESKKFWSNLPYQICNTDDMAEGPSKNENCWNGTSVNKYLPAVVGDGLNNQKQNPDVFVDINRQISILNEQIYALKAIVIKLQNAHKGMDVDWIDYEESFSTYASGSGSGDDDDTEPDLTDEEEGSGRNEDKTFSFNPEVPQVPAFYPPISAEVPVAHIPKNNYPKNITSNEIPDSSGTAAKSEMTLTRALITYLFPLIVIWLGGMFSDIL